MSKTLTKSIHIKFLSAAFYFLLKKNGLKMQEKILNSFWDEFFSFFKQESE
jgi:hypothetical protein